MAIPTSRLTAVLALIATTGLLSTAQSPDSVPLRNWYAPAFWLPLASGVSQPIQAKDSTVRAATAQPVGDNALVFVPITPCRVVDTRANSGFTNWFGPPGLSAKTARSFPIQASTTCSVPVAHAYSLNVTVVPPGADITVHPRTPTKTLRSEFPHSFNPPPAGATLRSETPPSRA